MSGVDEELHLGVLQFALAALAIEPEPVGEGTEQEQCVDEVSEARSIPRSLNHHRYAFNVLGVLVVVACPYLHVVGSGAQVVEDYQVLSLAQWHPLSVDVILEDDGRCLVIVREHRDTEHQNVSRCGHYEGR